MTQTMLIHVVPLALKYGEVLATFSTTHPTARFTASGELLIEFEKLPNVVQSTHLVLHDPPDTEGYDHYVHAYYAAPFERLKPWVREGEVNRSPEFLPGAIVEVVAVIFSQPKNGTYSSAVKLRHGRVRITIKYQGGDDPDIV